VSVKALEYCDYSLDGWLQDQVDVWQDTCLDIQRSETKILYVPWDIFKDVVDNECQILELQVDFSKNPLLA
jgi:hypothetical protein